MVVVAVIPALLLPLSDALLPFEGVHNTLPPTPSRVTTRLMASPSDVNWSVSDCNVNVTTPACATGTGELNEKVTNCRSPPLICRAHYTAKSHLHDIVCTLYASVGGGTHRKRAASISTCIRAAQRDWLTFNVYPTRPLTHPRCTRARAHRRCGMRGGSEGLITVPPPSLLHIPYHRRTPCCQPCACRRRIDCTLPQEKQHSPAALPPQHRAR